MSYLDVLKIEPSDFLGAFEKTYPHWGISKTHQAYGLLVGLGTAFCQRIKSFRWSVPTCVYPFGHDDQVFGLFTTDEIHCVDVNKQEVIREDKNETRHFLRPDYNKGVLGPDCSEL